MALARMTPKGWLWIFVPVLIAFIASPVKVQSDSGWAVPTAISLLRDGDLDLVEYEATLADRDDYRVVRSADGSLRPYFPVLVSLVAVPFVGAFDALTRAVEPAVSSIPPLASGVSRWRRHFDAVGRIDVTFFDTVELILASLLCALATAIFAAAAGHRFPRATAIATALVFALGTSVYSSASRLLWQQAVSLPLTCVLLWLLSRRQGRDLSLLLGIVVGLLYVARPTNAVAVPVVLLYLAWRRREAIPGYLLGGLLIAALLFAHAQLVYGTWLPPYYAPGRLGGDQGSFLEAAIGHWLSPSRGLAIYSPVILFGLGSFAVRLLRREVDPLELVSVGMIGLLWLSISSFPHWWGGHSFGPRLFTDAMPWCAWLLLRPIDEVRAGAWRRPWGVALMLAAVLSVAIHARGATSRRPHAWNTVPVDVDADPSRIWDWSDPQFLR